MSVFRKVKATQASLGVYVACSSPLLAHWAFRWTSHLCLWCVASAMPDLWLPSQL